MAVQAVPGFTTNKNSHDLEIGRAASAQVIYLNSKPVARIIASAQRFVNQRTLTNSFLEENREY